MDQSSSAREAEDGDTRMVEGSGTKDKRIFGAEQVLRESDGRSKTKLLREMRGVSWDIYW